MPFEEQLPEWNSPGVEPPASKKNTGWQAGEKPAADYWNWQMHRTYKALQELQQKAAEKADVGDMSTVPTTSKTAAGAITELFTSVSDGKALVAAAITDKGVPTSPTDTFATMAANIEAIPVGPDTSDATATSADILSGKTAYGAEGTKMTGTMPNRGNINQTLTTQGQEYTIPQGYHAGGGKVTANISNLTAANIAAGKTVGGVAGTFTSDATAAAGDILSGKTAYVNGSKITGTMPNRAGDTAALSSVVNGTTLKLLASAGYRDGVDDYVTITDPDFVAANIRSGVNIFGVVGNLEPRLFANGTGTVSSTTMSFQYISTNFMSSTNLPFVTVTGLTFEPNYIIIAGTSTESSLFGAFVTVYSVDYVKRSYGWNAEISVARADNQSAATWAIHLDGTNAYVTSSGFRLPALGSSNDKPVTWAAFR
jgi:hypothetical protein